MKVAVISDDTRTVSAHFGRAEYFLVYEIQDDTVKGKEMRPKPSHQHSSTITQLQNGTDKTPKETSFHDSMLASVRDCEVVIAGGMGYGMYSTMTQAGIKVFITDIVLADAAVKEYVAGNLVNHLERLH